MRLGWVLTLSIVIIVLLFIAKPLYTGLVVISRGGQVTQVDVNLQKYRFWHGVYGNMSLSGSENITVETNGTGQIYMTDIEIGKCFNTEIYASTGPINWSNLSPALPSMIDNYLGLAPGDYQSGTRVFTNTTFFNITDIGMLLNSTRLNSVNGTYDLGLLTDGTNIIFVTRPQPGALGFDGNNVDIQMMLPAPYDQNVTYQFSPDPWDSDDCNYTSRHGFTAVLHDNGSITLYWEEDYANSYKIYVTYDLDVGFNFGSPAATGITQTQWTDINATGNSDKFYKYSSIYGVTEVISATTVGKNVIYIPASDGNPAGYELSQFSFPLMPFNQSFENIVRNYTFGDIYLRFNTSDLGTQFVGWQTNLNIGATWLKQFDSFSLYEGYVPIMIQNPYYLTYVGAVPEGIVNISVFNVTGSPGNHEMMLLGWNSMRTDCNLLSALNTTNSPSVVTWFNNTDLGATYEGWQTFLLLNNGTPTWFPTDGCMIPTKGYRFLSVPMPYTWSYNRSIS